MKKYYLETYGCQMNSAESNALEAILQGAGWTASASQQDADLAIINTCSVRQSAENRIWGRLGSYNPIKKQKKITLVVTGCMADRLGEDIKKKAPQVDYVVPVNDKMHILEIVDKVSADMCSSDKYEFTSSYWKEGEFSSYVPIMNGCNNFCSYCI
ncbi:MAG: tRNA (N6-isopentenyl adenosine(37)-C2)-methylthiotransferase MiaB, partial [Spirochaetales bacterium]